MKGSILCKANPSPREEIEAAITAKIESGEAETGLYNVGLSYVAVGEDALGEITFQWFDHMIPIVDVIDL